MTLLARLISGLLLGVVLLGTTMTSCSTVSEGSGAKITKVKYYFLDPVQILRTTEPSLLFERQHYLHGAYTASAQIARTGHYYTVTWKAEDRTQPVTVRFEYRQANTALKVMAKEQVVTDVRKRNETHFQVIGPDYQEPVPLGTVPPKVTKTGGRVTAWRVSLLRGKEELVSQQSYLWK